MKRIGTQQQLQYSNPLRSTRKLAKPGSVLLVSLSLFHATQARAAFDIKPVLDSRAESEEAVREKTTERGSYLRLRTLLKKVGISTLVSWVSGNHDYLREKALDSAHTLIQNLRSSAQIPDQSERSLEIQRVSRGASILLPLRGKGKFFAYSFKDLIDSLQDAALNKYAIFNHLTLLYSLEEAIPDLKFDSDYSKFKKETHQKYQDALDEAVALNEHYSTLLEELIRTYRNPMTGKGDAADQDLRTAILELLNDRGVNNKEFQVNLAKTDSQWQKDFDSAFKKFTENQAKLASLTQSAQSTVDSPTAQAPSAPELASTPADAPSLTWALLAANEDMKAQMPGFSVVELAKLAAEGLGRKSDTDIIAVNVDPAQLTSHAVISAADYLTPIGVRAIMSQDSLANIKMDVKRMNNVVSGQVWDIVSSIDAQKLAYGLHRLLVPNAMIAPKGLWGKVVKVSTSGFGMVDPEALRAFFDGQSWKRKYRSDFVKLAKRASKLSDQDLLQEVMDIESRGNAKDQLNHGAMQYLARNSGPSGLAEFKDMWTRLVNYAAQSGQFDPNATAPAQVAASTASGANNGGSAAPANPPTTAPATTTDPNAPAAAQATAPATTPATTTDPNATTATTPAATADPNAPAATTPAVTTPVATTPAASTPTGPNQPWNYAQMKQLILTYQAVCENPTPNWWLGSTRNQGPLSTAGGAALSMSLITSAAISISTAVTGHLPHWLQAMMHHLPLIGN